MSSCIKAYYRREERYEGMQLVFGEHKELKQKILDAIEETCKETGLKPNLFENVDRTNPKKEAIYMEFEDDYDREGNGFFEIVMKKLDIVECG